MPQFTIRQKSQSGQVLLVLVLLIALVITVLSSVSYRLTIETQATKSQEENVRVLAAADSGIEKGISMINNPSAPSVGQFRFSDPLIALTGLPSIDAERSNILITNSAANDFVSPEVPQDDQYTFYVADYPNFTNSYTGNLIFYFGSDGAGDCLGARSRPALEVSIVYGQNNELVDRLLYEPCTTDMFIAGAYGSKKILPVAAATTLSGNSFSYHTTNNPLNMSLFPEAKMVVVRTLFAKTRVGFSSGGIAQLPSQGKLIRSEAVSKAGSSKVVTLTQSLPQIPADFFVTTF